MAQWGQEPPPGSDDSDGDLSGEGAPPPWSGVADPSEPTQVEVLTETDPLVIYTRRAWGARPPKSPAQILKHGPDRIVVHHTDTINVDDVSRDNAFLLSRKIQDFHMFSRGWDDTGQQLTISRGGYVMEGRNRSLLAMHERRNVLGAQTLRQNDHTLGIENEGNYMTNPVPGALWASLVKTCTWLCSLYGLDPHKAIAGHRDFLKTNCPGDVLYHRLPELRDTVAANLDQERGGRNKPGRSEPHLAH
jgi:hypothetical protein